MSTIRADNYSKRVGSSTISADTLLQGTAKAWGNLNGTGTIANRDSFNVSSYTDNGTGDYTANLTTALTSGSTAAYQLSVAGSSLLVAPSVITGITQGIISSTAFRGGARIPSDFTGNGAVTDVIIWNFSIHGDP